MAEKDKRYYWLKLKRDFFKRHDIRIVENQTNGKEYILFYLKLLCESVDHDGNLRFSDQIPYNEEMLATITNTNVDIVRNAVRIFSELNMMQILDDGTLFMNQVQEMIGSETYWAEQKRKQKQRQMQCIVENVDSDVGHFPTDVQQMSNDVQDVSNDSPTCPSKSKSKSKSKSINNNTPSNIPQEFDLLWDMYPKYKKQGKKKAIEAYRRARKSGTSFEEVRSGLESYVRYIEAEHIEDQFIKQGGTFFTQNAWDGDWVSRRMESDDLDGIL